jgi:hypothetical protein
MREPRLAQVYVHVDQTGGDDEIARINLVNFGLRTSDFGFRRDDLSVFDKKISNSIATVRWIDDTAVANDGRAHFWGAQAASL